MIFPRDEWDRIEREDGIIAIESKDDYVAFKFNLYLKDGYIPCTRYVSKKMVFGEMKEIE